MNQGENNQAPMMNSQPSGNTFQGLLNAIINNPTQAAGPCVPMELQQYSTVANYEGFSVPNFPTAIQSVPPSADYCLPAANQAPLMFNSSLQVPCHNQQLIFNPLLPSTQYHLGNEKAFIGKSSNPFATNKGDFCTNLLNPIELKDLQPIRNVNNEENISAPNNPGQVIRRNKRSYSLFGEKSSIYRGVTKYPPERFEAFLWDNTVEGKKGKTIYIGAYKTEVEAARVYDLAAINFWGQSIPTNFPAEEYEEELNALKDLSKKEVIQALRRKGKEASKKASNYHGVFRDYKNKKWKANFGKGEGNKGRFLGTFETTEDAARAYDVASIKLQGINAVTNFDISDYDVESIRKNLNLPKGKCSSRLWTKKTLDDVLLHREKNEGASSSTLQNQLVDEAVDPYIPTLNFFHTNPNPSFLDDWRSTESTGAQAGNSGGTEFGGVGFRNYGVPVENPNNSWMKSFGVESSINAIWSTEFQTIQPYEQFDQNAPQNQLLNVEQLQDQNENTNQILNQSSNFSLLGGDYQNPSCQSHNSNSLNGLPAGVEADDLEEGLGKSFDMSDIASILAADF